MVAISFFMFDTFGNVKAGLEIGRDHAWVYIYFYFLTILHNYNKDFV